MNVKMKFISITGPKYDFDRVTDAYLSKYEIQLENALSELKTVDNLTPFTEVNPYKDALAKATQFVGYLKNTDIDTSGPPPTVDDMFTLIRNVNHDYMEIKTNETNLRAERDSLKEKLKIVEPFKPLQFDLHQVLQYKYIKFRFGRISLDYYHKLTKYIYEDLNVIFLEGGRDSNYIYGVYFVAKEQSEKLDAICKSMHFERLFLPDEYEGNPMDACQKLEEDINSLTLKTDHIGDDISTLLQKDAAMLIVTQRRLEELSNNFELRRVAACIEDKHEKYYVLCGWMADTDVTKFLHDIRDDENLFVVVEDDRTSYFGDPPTKLKNPKLFKPFEVFIRMYGLPAHNEMDPTIFVALSYAFIFGVMFGDLGQGACLFIGGTLIYKFKKAALAGVIACAGFFSMFFGWMFGSVFGFENIIEARWLRPLSAMTDLPFIGKLNTVFIVAVAFGMAIILLSMIFNIINSLRAHDTEKAWFDPNGVAGLVFYGSIVAIIVLFMTGHQTPAAALMVIMFGIPLLLMFFREPISKKLEKRSVKIKEGVGMFLVQGFFELFETLLSYFSNTLSFVRIGAFAVSHAAMMQVVLMLGGAESGQINWVIIVIGNLFVCGMEGLIVGIQVLRLEYYEMFSRFYRGTGREFKPYSNKQKKDKN
ncbi:MAG: V-type ATPase 116kDa subunit family protein [Lachnospiraceae bacterium]|nr:V-type ATPase 116kDa subunit family protein [Lachnospiraceae bacterium]